MTAKDKNWKKPKHRIVMSYSAGNGVEGTQYQLGHDIMYKAGAKKIKERSTGAV